MAQNFKFTKNFDGTYDLVIAYDKGDTEFGKDFFSAGNLQNLYGQVSKFVKKQASDFKVKNVKILVGGLLVATIPFLTMLNSMAAKYSMSYLYFGTVSQQITYVNRTNKSLETVAPSYFDLNSDGSLKLNNIDGDFIRRLHENGVKVVPFLSNHWDRTSGAKAVNNYQKLADQIVSAINTYNLDGVNVDLENLTPAERDNYSAFVGLLRTKLPSNKEVSVAVAANPSGWTTGWQGSYDYAKLAQNSDYLMLMAYDEHFDGGGTGPVASIAFVENSIKYALTKTNPGKIVLGLPFYGRIWSDNGLFQGYGVDTNKVNTFISDYNATVTYDNVRQAPVAVFEVKPGDKSNVAGGKTLTPGNYTIWYENERSLEEKIKLINKYNLKGAGSWALGQEPVGLWDNYNIWLNGGSSPLINPSTPITPASTPAPTEYFNSNNTPPGNTVVPQTSSTSAFGAQPTPVITQDPADVQIIMEEPEITLQETEDLVYDPIFESGSEIKNTVEDTSEAPEPVVTVKSDANIYSSGSAGALIIGVVLANTRLRKISKGKKFTQVLFKNKKGYMKISDL
ncbi:MAG: hypothetical protein LBI03_00105 [Clostridiales bacterium]|jgi:spore germination protein YaaH|nr:hypothetical protein [Clostridiales bacterium]